MDFFQDRWAHGRTGRGSADNADCRTDNREGDFTVTCFEQLTLPRRQKVGPICPNSQLHCSATGIPESLRNTTTRSSSLNASQKYAASDGICAMTAVRS